MKRFTMFACLALALVFALSSYAGEMPRVVRADQNDVIVGGGQTFAKASRDTAVIAGPNSAGAQIIGTFQDGGGNASWNGFTHFDITQPTEVRWYASTYFAVTGVYSAWCGEDIPSCGGGDPDGGYDSNYNEILEWRGAVANNGASCTVTVTANLQHDTEPGYDYTWLSYWKFDQPIINVFALDGNGLVAVNESFSYAPGDYMGVGSNEVVVQFRVTSDGGWSDGDCSWPTAGACQLDDVVISLTNGTGYSHDFEDGTLGDFTVEFPQGVGDFAKLWTGLEDFDACFTNYSTQVAFIDDGVVVPGTGGTPCVNWCYGPGGYIVNTTGGLATPDDHLHNAIESPVALWLDQTHDGTLLEFDVYVHEDLATDSPGMFYTWSVRSGLSEAECLSAGWVDRNYVYYGGGIPGYFRPFQAVGDLMQPGRTHVQLQFTVYELGWVWGAVGNDGYPAPYFDNISLKTYPVVGPGITTRALEMAQDNFPAIGQVDYVNLGDNSVRFDMANNISLPSHNRNDPGDSITFNCAPQRAGAALTANPVMHYKLKANPVFDAYRTSGLPNEGTVVCDSVRNAAGLVVADKWFADLPDEFFFYPGDILHFYFQASDDVGGDVQTALLPADTTGYSNFDPYQPNAYNQAFTVRALPSVNAGLTHPPVLFWADYGTAGNPQWYNALANLGLLQGVDYDTYYTQAPTSGVGNGLGGRATLFDIEGYTDMLYSCGNLSVYSISNGDFVADAGDDATLMTLWMQQTDKDLLVTGDDLAADMAGSGSTTQTFLEQYMGLSFVNTDIRPLIGNQSAPRVLVEAGNPVFATVNSWIAYGGCVGINIFDAVTPLSGPGNTATRIAQFANASGNPGGYVYSAATENVLANGNSVVSLPYDFRYVYTDPDEAKAAAGLSARVRMLGDILQYFGIQGSPGQVTGVPGADKLAAANFPNPFNPKTNISYTIAKPGHMTLKIFNVRGELVKTLIDGHVDVSSTIEWDGTNNAGGKVSSGVYFYEARMGNDVVVNKMALVK